MMTEEIVKGRGRENGRGYERGVNEASGERGKWGVMVSQSAMIGK